MQDDDSTALLRGQKDVDSLPKDESRSGTISSSIAVILNTILGTGMLAMPKAFSSGGVFLGCITVVWCGSTAALGLYFLSRSAAYSHAHFPSQKVSFASLSSLSFPGLSRLFDLAIFLKCFGVSVSYLIIIGSLTPRVIQSFFDSGGGGLEPHWAEDRRMWILLSMTILTPLAFLRQIGQLKFISYIALCAVANLLFVVIYKFIEPSGIPERGPITFFDLSPNYFSSLPVQTFAFTCAQNLFSVFNELKSNTQPRLNLVITTSIGSASIVYLVLGVLGYLTFGSQVGGNIVEMYPHSLLVSICQAAIVILVLFSYPLQLHPCRASLHHLLMPEVNTDSTIYSSHDSDESEIPLGYFVIETGFILLTTFIISIFVTKLETVLGIVGATGSTTISFILPSLFFLKLFKNSNDIHDRKLMIIAVCLLSWGVSVMLGSLGLQLWHIFSSNSNVLVLGVGK